MRRALEPTDYPFFDYRRFTFSLATATAQGVWLAGSTAVQYDKATQRMAVSGNLVEQARVIHDKMSKTLAAGGLGLGDITRLVQYLSPSALKDLPRLMEFHAARLGAPSISTIVVNRLLREEALIEIEAVVSCHDALDITNLPTVCGPSQKDAWQWATRQLQDLRYGNAEILRTLELRSSKTTVGTQRPTNAPKGSFAEIIIPCLPDGSQGVQIEMAASRRKNTDIIYATAVGQPAAGGIVGQTRQAYCDLFSKLQRDGLDFSHVVKTTEFITPEGLADYRRTAEIRRGVFAAPFPAATGVICDRLPQAGSQIAVEAIAVRSQNEAV